MLTLVKLSMLYFVIVNSSPDTYSPFSEDIYKSLRETLIERVLDREVSVRVQAVIALSKLCGTEDPSEVPEGECATDILVDALAHDASAQVKLHSKVHLSDYILVMFDLPHCITFLLMRLHYQQLLTELVILTQKFEKPFSKPFWNRT